jgi:D-amino-acid oxidase
MDRRTLLKALAAYSGGAVLDGCIPTHAGPAPTPTARGPAHLAKVLVSPDREIRTTVCLRPFRAPGFRLVAERFGDKLCVHNYGHGGAGITLSWGTAQLACDVVRGAEPTQVAVLGCGVIGLSTARLLQQMGREVTIYAKALPPETTSNSAGGLWQPYSVFDPGKDTPQFRQQFAQSVAIAYAYFQQFAGDDYGVHWMPTYALSSHPFADPQATPFPMAAVRELQPREHRFPFPYVREWEAMLIEPHAYMRALLRDFRLAGGNVVLREFHAVSDVTALTELVIVNCTVLGSQALFADTDLVPIKGQLTYLLPQPEVDYIVLAGDLYMFPRRDGIVLGGTHVRGDWTLDPDPAAKSQVLAGHAKLFSRL